MAEQSTPPTEKRAASAHFSALGSSVSSLFGLGANHEEASHASTPTHRGSHTSMAISNANAQDPEVPEDALIDQVMRDARASPLSREEFLAFLKKEHASELGEFWMAGEKHRALASNKIEDAAKVADEVVAKFIRRGAKDEVNLPETMRIEIETRVAKEDGAKLDPKLFLPAKREVKSMLLGGPFTRFVKKQMETNITDDEAYRRYGAGIALGLVSAGIVALFMALQVTSDVPELKNRWLRVLSFPTLMWSVGLFLSAKQRVCQGLAAQCVAMRPGDTWISAYTQQPQITKVTDQLALAVIQAKARWMSQTTVALSLVITAIILALPPGYGIGAP